ncbi:Hypothetical predicted protein [Octopus vulgaris]|uniref:Mitochondrial inner membrane protease subunit 2 n=1 Tax=Octopus vulgaris TaxID=6645 RepID=A0AA36AV84_OCTVU|nr:Hypothetical predicted protein [Octopus vulgaris]
MGSSSSSSSKDASLFSRELKRKMLRVALGTAVTVAPMVIFFHDNIGFIAKVEGASMQPALNPEGQRTSDYVFLNKWKAKNHHYIRGEVVSLIRYNVYHVIIDIITFTIL